MVIQRFFYTFIILCGGLFFSSPALAMSDSVSVRAVVAEVRVIYLDSDKEIEKVAGNTSSDIIPTASLAGRPVSMDAKIYAQYNHLLAKNNNRLQAGQTYFSEKYNPYRLLAAWLLNNSVFNSRLY